MNDYTAIFKIKLERTFLKRDRSSKEVVYILIASIILTTILNYTALYYYNKYQAEEIRKKNIKLSKIQYIDKQLNEFYIPLKIKLLESEKHWLNIKEEYRDGTVYSDFAKGVDNDDTKRWQIYMLKVFQPIHIVISSILSKQNLVLNKKEIQVRLDVLTQHIAHYQVIFTYWNEKNKTQNFAKVHFPSKLILFIQQDIKILKNKKQKLLRN